MRETIEMVVKALVDDAEAVEVREVEREELPASRFAWPSPTWEKLSASRAAPCGHLRSLVYAAGLKASSPLHAGRG